ncbi:DNA ligase 1-like [Apium graveolens]|uniref:DNA ligase 1-like n=1 Tax=Apium graveolens TaxID=4045 RepID=UPI003D7ABB57
MRILSVNCILKSAGLLNVPLSSRYQLPNNFSFSPTPYTFNPNKSETAMSNSPPPSAFDTLMYNARAAAKNKPHSLSSPTKKRKTHDSNTSKILQNSTLDNARYLFDKMSQRENVENRIPSENTQVFPNGPEQEKVIISLDIKKPGLITLDESIAELKKKGVNFDPKKAAFWRNGANVPFSFIARVFDAIEIESGRNVITEIVCNMLRTVMDTSPDELVRVVYLLANKLAPAHEGVELGIGDASIIKALAEACGCQEAQIKKQYEELGDLGLVAKASRSSQSLMRKPEALTVNKVFNTFRLIAKESGKDSQEKKKNHIKALLVAATECEPKYLIRLLQTKLRIGLAEQTLLAALGHAAYYSELHSSPPTHRDSPLEEAANIVKQVYSVIPVYDKLVHAILTDGVWNLRKTCNFSPGIPVGPMLAKPTKRVSEIFDKFQNLKFTCEYKYDGERAQIHYMENGSVEIYSRSAERNTSKFPDVVAAISRLKKSSVSSFVLDCEFVAYDREKKKILPFQVLSSRARKNVMISDIKVEVCIYAFDMLYLNGQTLLQEQLIVRKEHLYDSFKEESGYFQFAKAMTSSDLEEIQTFLENAVDASCEGLIIKTLSEDATYEPSKRSNNWLKLKKDYMESFGDSLDLVPIAAFHGRGNRTGVYGAFLLACYDSNKEVFQTICKLGTGLTDKWLEQKYTTLSSKVIPTPKSYYCYSDGKKPDVPDVWFEATEVWEVKASDLTISPVYCAATGIVDSGKGISLRFPRLVRVREDKTPEQASSSDMVADMYNAQNHTKIDIEDNSEDE